MRAFHYSAIRSQKWDSEMLGLIAAIYKEAGKQELYLKQRPEELEKLVEIAKIQSTEASNAIEGIVTTSTRIRQLVEEKTTPKNRDEQEIVGAEIDGVQHTRKIARALAGDLIDAHFPALAAGQLDLHGKVAAAGKDAAGEPCRVGFKGDHLLLRAGTGRLGAGEVDGGLEQVRLALRVLADDDVDRGIEGHALVRVVAEMLQRDGVKSHIRR